MEQSNEQLYRGLGYESSSSLREFAKDRKKYYRRYILKEPEKKEEDKASTMGRMVETILLESEEFDNRFYIPACQNLPTGLMLSFVQYLYEFTEAATDSNGMVTKPFSELALAAYTESGFKLKFETVIDKFTNSDASIYYEELRKVKARGLTLVDMKDVTNAENIVEELKNNFVTRDIVNLTTNHRYTIHNQLQIVDFMIDGYPFKAMLDKVVIDHLTKTLQVYDLKCIWAVETFFRRYYLERMAYMQAYVYMKAAEHLVNMDPALKDYKILNMRFMVCDSNNYYGPLIYELSPEDIQHAYEGFFYRDDYYPGVKETLEQLRWAISNDVWNISMPNYINNGIVKLRESNI